MRFSEHYIQSDSQIQGVTEILTLVINKTEKTYQSKPPDKKTGLKKYSVKVCQNAFETKQKRQFLKYFNFEQIWPSLNQFGQV